jgi:hypothetical protein
MKREEVRSTEDLLAYILEHEDTIYVLEEVNGEREDFALKDLTPRRKAQRILKFLAEGYIPITLKLDSGMEATKNENKNH